VDDTQSDGSYELVSEVADEEQRPQTARQVQREGKAEIVEIDVNQNETMGQILHRTMKMRMKKNIHAGPVQPWTSRGKEWLGLDPRDTGFGDVAGAPSKMWRLARMGQQSSMECSVQTFPGKGYMPRAVDHVSSSRVTKQERGQRKQLQC